MERRKVASISSRANHWLTRIVSQSKPEPEQRWMGILNMLNDKLVHWHATRARV